MENLNMALISSSSSSPKLFLLGYSNPYYTLKNPTNTFSFRTSGIAPRRRSRISVSAHASPLPRLPQICNFSFPPVSLLFFSFTILILKELNLVIKRKRIKACIFVDEVLRKVGDERFASISSSSNQQNSSVGVNPYPTVPPPSSQM